MTSKRMFLKNQLILRDNLKISYAKKDMPGHRLQVGQTMSLSNDLIELYQSVSYAKPTPIWKSFLNVFDYNYYSYYLGNPVERHTGWTKDHPQIWGLGYSPIFDLDEHNQAKQLSNFYLPDLTDKLSDLKYREQSLRGPYLELLMNYLMELNEIHGYGLPKFKKVGPSGTLTEFDPTSCGSFNHKLTVNDLPSFGLYGHSWYYNLYIAQIQDWLDQLSKVLKFPNGPSISSWLPKVSFYSDDLQFNEDLDDPNMRKYSWSPKSPSDIGKYGKPNRNYHHRVFPNSMARANYPTPLTIQAVMPMQATLPYNSITSPALDAFVPIDEIPAQHYPPYGLPWNKESDGNYYIYLYNTSETPKKYFKARIANVNFNRAASGPSYPIGYFNSTVDATRNYAWYPDDIGWLRHYYDGTPSGRQYFDPNWQVATHDISLFYVAGGNVTKRFGITSSNPTTFFDFGYANNPGYYFGNQLPVFPESRDISPITSVYGPRVFNKVKLSVGKLNYPGGRYTIDAPSYIYYGGEAPPPPFQYFQRQNADGSYSDKKEAYLSTDKAILDEVAGQIESGEAITICDLNLADIPVTEYQTIFSTGVFDIPSLSTYWVSDIHRCQEQVDMSPLFDLDGGQYVFVCVSYHDFFVDFMPGINCTYDLVDAFNAASYRIKNLGRDPLSFMTLGQSPLRNYFTPVLGPYSWNPNYYYQKAINDGIYPGPMQHQWRLGTNNGNWGGYGLATHTDGYVWR